jgi:chemotaxis protein CheD
MIKQLKEVISVGIADLNVVKSPHVIRTSGLGSCVGAVIYDLQKQVAGLAHIMLPDSVFAKQGQRNDFKYADTAVTILVKKLCSNGARRNHLQAKFAGGAQMFQFSSGTDLMRIGPRNAEAVREKLKLLQIPVIAEDVGGNRGRTIEFDPETGLLKIKTVNKGETFI